mmetsp:Transcript_22575/g.53299  ORF Transcript_22575/g.53299 Transcript_22575/m.53299 type:complete len:129 (-) Transcript_22575:1789-2175(-)
MIYESNERITPQEAPLPDFTTTLRAIFLSFDCGMVTPTACSVLSRASMNLDAPMKPTPCGFPLEGEKPQLETNPKGCFTASPFASPGSWETVKMLSPTSNLPFPSHMSSQRRIAGNESDDFSWRHKFD